MSIFELILVGISKKLRVFQFASGLQQQYPILLKLCPQIFIDLNQEKFLLMDDSARLSFTSAYSPRISTIQIYAASIAQPKKVVPW